MELTNQTYLRSRVDMQWQTAWHESEQQDIAGVLGNARENAEVFSRYPFQIQPILLQSRRANIQNFFLPRGSKTRSWARDIMERIALTKLKFDSHS